MAARHHFYDMLERGFIPASGATPQKFLTLPGTAGCFIAYGTTVPSDATTGYAAGAIFIHTDGSGQTAIYVNRGSATSCDFNALQDVTSTLTTDLAIGTNSLVITTNNTSYTNVATTNNPMLSFRSATTNAASPYGWVPVLKIGTVQHYAITCTQPNP